jgi:sugar lactone lactonase YvrE
MLWRPAIAAAAVGMVLAGCSQSQLGQATGANPAVRAPSAQPRVKRSKPLPAQLLFLTTGLDTIDIYSLSKPDQPLQTIDGLQEGQQQMDVDAAGNLYVVNNGNLQADNYVGVYAPPYDESPTILATTWQGVTFFPIGVTVDASGTVYVTTCGRYCGETPAVYVYPKGATVPSKQVTASGFDSLSGLAVDRSSNIYVINWLTANQSVDVWKSKAGALKFAPLRLRGLITGDGGNGLSLDAAGNLFVSSISSGTNFIAEYKPGKRNAARIIDSMPFTQEAEMIDVGPDGNLYAPMYCSFAPCSLAYGFKPGAKKAFESIGTGQAGVAVFGAATAPNLQLEGSR